MTQLCFKLASIVYKLEQSQKTRKKCLNLISTSSLLGSLRNYFELVSSEMSDFQTVLRSRWGKLKKQLEKLSTFLIKINKNSEIASEERIERIL